MTEPTYGNAPATTSGAGTNGAAIAALITGIIALLLSWIPGINLLAFLLGIVAVVTGVIGLRNANQRGEGRKGMAIAGLVTGILALIVGVLVYVGLASFINNNPELQQQIQEQQQNG